MQVKFVINPYSIYSAFTHGSTVTVNVARITRHSELIDGLIHEAFHAVLNELGIKTTEKQDHFIMKRMNLEWF